DKAIATDDIYTAGILRPLPIVVTGVRNPLYLGLYTHGCVYRITYETEFVQGIVDHLILMRDTILYPDALQVVCTFRLHLRMADTAAQKKEHARQNGQACCYIVGRCETSNHGTILSFQPYPPVLPIRQTARQ